MLDSDTLGHHLMVGVVGGLTNNPLLSPDI